MSDRLSRKDLREDALVSQTARAADFMSQHGKAVFGGLAVVIIIAVAVVFMRTSALRSEDRAAGLLTDATVEYGRGNYSAASTKLDELFGAVGGTASGKRARLLRGDVLYAQGAYQPAADAYEQALDAFGDDPILGSAARRGLAASLESLGENARAAEIYGQLVESAPNGVIRAELRLNQGRNLVLAGRASEAVPVFEAVERNRDNPRAAQTARLRLAEARRVAG